MENSPPPHSLIFDINRFVIYPVSEIISILTAQYGSSWRGTFTLLERPIPRGLPALSSLLPMLLYTISDPIVHRFVDPVVVVTRSLPSTAWW